MSSICIKNIGPIVDTGRLELSRFNILIGKQSTGKSTIMKILCFCKWIEKRIMTGSEDALSKYTHYNRFIKELMQFHRLNADFFSVNSEIHFVGDCVTIDLRGKTNAKIERSRNFDREKYNTKLCFIPSERNLVSAIKNVDRAYKSNDLDLLFNHIFEWSEAKEHYTEKQPILLPFLDNIEYFYDKNRDIDVIRLKDKRKDITPFYASSGVQSALPIVVMVNYFTRQILDKTIDLSKRAVYDILDKLLKRETKEQEDAPTSIISLLTSDEYKQIVRIYSYQSCHLFIEEPEQNLFPESQQALIQNIVESISLASKETSYDSSVTITTHSPYVITAFNVLLKAFVAFQADSGRASEIVDVDSMIPIDNIRAYYIGDKGKVHNIVDRTMKMMSGNDLDSASDFVEEKLNRLDEIIYGA